MDFDTIHIEKVIPGEQNNSRKMAGLGEFYTIHSRSGLAFEIAVEGCDLFVPMPPWYYKTAWRQVGVETKDDTILALVATISHLRQRSFGEAAV